MKRWRPVAHCEVVAIAALSGAFNLNNNNKLQKSLGEPMRNVARLKMGYYPLPESEGVKLRALLSFAQAASVIDPCVGQGTALHLVSGCAEVRRHRVELDAERARIASSRGIETIQGNAFDAVAKSESFSLLYLNPPYDSEIGSVANNRMERLFLDHTCRWLVPEGVLVFVIPFERLHDCAGVLASHFGRLSVLRMTDEESVRFRQIVVLGVRRNIRGTGLEDNKRMLQSISPYGSFHALPELTPSSCAPYSVPPSGEAALSYRGLPYDLLEDLLPQSGAWRQTIPFLFAGNPGNLASASWTTHHTFFIKHLRDQVKVQAVSENRGGDTSLLQVLFTQVVVS
jgi:hypothetical protein